MAVALATLATPLVKSFSSHRRHKLLGWAGHPLFGHGEPQLELCDQLTLSTFVNLTVTPHTSHALLPPGNIFI